MKSNPQSIRGCKNTPFIEINFFEWTRFPEGKLFAKSVDKYESRILFSGKNQISPSEGGF